MKFSILITIYNAEEYIKRCIDSVLKQKKEDFEILLYNDASSDNSGRLCDEYCSRYPDVIKVFHSPVNKGSINGRLELYKKAMGEIIIWMDADDYMSSNALHEIGQAFRTYNCDLVIYEFYKRYQMRWGGVLYKRRSDYPRSILYREKEKKQLYGYFASQKCNSLWRKAFKRKLFDTIFCKEVNTEDINLGDDLLLSLSIIDNAQTAVYLHKTLYYYCQHSSSMLQTTALERGWDSLEKVWDIAEPYFENRDVISQYYKGVIDNTCSYLGKIKENYSDSNEEEIISLLKRISGNVHLRRAVDYHGMKDKRLEGVMSGKYKQFLDMSDRKKTFLAILIKRKLFK